MIATKDYIDLLATGLSVKTKINLVDAGSWQYNPQKNELGYDGQHLRQLPYQVVRGLLLHEVGHVRYTSSFEFDMKNPLVVKWGRKTMMDCYNAMEDIRIEKKLIRDYGDFALNSLDTMNLFVEMKRRKEGGDLTKHPKFVQYLMTMITMHHCYNSGDYEDALQWWEVRDTSSDGHNIAQDRNHRVSPEVQEVLTKNFQKTMAVIKKCHHASSIQEIMEIVHKDLEPIIRPLMEKNDEDPNQSSAGEGATGEELDSQGNPTNGQGQGAGNADYLKGSGNRFSLEDQDEITAFDKPTESEAKSILRPLSLTLGNRLKDILKELKSTRYTGNHLIGKLLSKNTYKAVLNESRIFSKRNHPDTPDYDVWLALDDSGSMEGPKATTAFMSACLLADACKRIGLKIRIFKFDTNATELKNLDQYDGTGGGTADESVLEAIDKQAQGGRENIIFVVTDGETRRSNNFFRIHSSLLKKNSLIFGVGIGSGILESTLKENYDHHLHVQKVEDLPLALVNLMRGIIHR